MKTQPHKFLYKISRSPKSHRVPWGYHIGGSWDVWGAQLVMGFSSRKVTHTCKQCTDMLKIIWEHRASLLLLLLYHLLHFPLSLSVSLKAEGLICVISCSNHTGVTWELIDMQWDNPTSASNISVCPASKQHHLPALSEHTCTTNIQIHTPRMQNYACTYSTYIHACYK